MILSKKSSAWLLFFLQFFLGFSFIYCLKPLSGTNHFQLAGSPSWFTALVLLHSGITLILFLFALWKYELTAIALLFAIHIVCPLIFFTDLTRNPYFTQIVLLYIWIAFLWIVWMWDCVASGKFLFPKTALDLPFLLFFIAASVSWGFSFLTHPASFYSSMFHEGIKNILFLIVNAYGVFYLAVMLDNKWRNRFIWITFWIGGIAAAYGLMQFYGIEKIWQKSLTPFANRPVSTFGNPNFLSSYLLLLVPLLVATLMTTKKTISAFYSFILLVILITGIIATMTRSTWVGTLFAILLLPMVNSVRDFIKKNHKKLALIVLILIASVVFWPKSKLGGYENPWQRVIEVKNAFSSHGSYQPWHQRMLIWSSCWDMMKNHLILGKGWGLLELFYPYYQGKKLDNPILTNLRTHANNAHNEVIEVWSQTGFLGMGIYAWIWIVLIFFGFKSANYFWSMGQNEKSIFSWSITTAALGMFIDNFFGNVSLHFAVPAMLFWWQAGILFSVTPFENQGKKNNINEWYNFSIENNMQKSLLSIAAIFLFGTCVFHFSKEFQEIYYFRGFKVAKSSQMLDQARNELESAWKWFPKEVNTDYELANNYARLSHQSAQMGLTAQSQNWRKKAIWAYVEALKSNCGYDEIFFNLATTQMQTGWIENQSGDISTEDPRSMPVTLKQEEIQGAIYNFSRAIAINPLSQDAYSFLGGVFLKDPKTYGESGILLFDQASRYFPKNRDFLINLAYLQIQSQKMDEAYHTLKKALVLDPFNELTRKNIRAALAQMRKTQDPLLEIDQALEQLNPLVQAKDWTRLRTLFERAVQNLPDCFQLHFILGNIYYELKQLNQAENQYQEVLKLDSRNTSALNNLALIYRMQNRIEDAKKIFKKLIEINPEDSQSKAQLQSLS